ncbi:unnamed protein product [Rotaria sp. Silwood2]|nr:unnamed protein product [Rotaria sp. Silwood2]CAF4457610.1 unnamed protein product [Rotaria sp. Silwood2]
MYAKPNYPTLGKKADDIYLLINVYLIVNVKCLAKVKSITEKLHAMSDTDIEILLSKVKDESSINNYLMVHQLN